MPILLLPEKTIWGIWTRLPAAGLDRRELCGFFVSSIKLNFTQKAPACFSCRCSSLHSGVSGWVLCPDQGMSVSIWMLWRCWSCSISSHQHVPPGATSGVPLSPAGTLSHRACVWRAAGAWCSSSWKDLLGKPPTMVILSRISLLRLLQKCFYAIPFCREHRIPFSSHSHSVVFAWMLQMRVLLDVACIKKNTQLYL